MRLVLAAVAVICIQQLGLSSFAESRSVEGKIKIRLYVQSSGYFHEEFIKQGHTLLTESNGYNKTKPIVFIVHGMAMGADSPFVNGLIDAFVEREMQDGYNILSVDMPELFENSLINDFYIGVLGNVQPAGREIGEFLNTVINFGLSIPENINMMGYSIGAQVAGYAARLVKKVFGQINYIGGLDPAGPGFHALFGRVSRLTHVSREDARIAHFFHTNSISCGTRDRIGTADFVYNDGGRQPGCVKDSPLECSHIRVPYLYIEAVANPENFVARHCASWNQFVNCECDQHEVASITFPPDEKAHGIYYLRTHSKSPYGMGEAGARCRKKVHPVSDKGYHEKIIIENDPVFSETKDPLKNQKTEGLLRLKHHHRLKDNLNIHLINGIRKLEEFHSEANVPEQTESYNDQEALENTHESQENNKSDNSNTVKGGNANELNEKVTDFVTNKNFDQSEETDEKHGTKNNDENEEDLQLLDATKFQD